MRINDKTVTQITNPPILGVPAFAACSLLMIGADASSRIAFPKFHLRNIRIHKGITAIANTNEVPAIVTSRTT